MSSTVVETQDSRPQADSSIFQGFWIGGFECSTHRLPRRKSLGRFAGQRLDLVNSTRHDRFAFEDYSRLQQAGMRTVRDGVRWHLIETAPFRYDFSSLLPMLRAKSIHVVVGGIALPNPASVALHERFGFSKVAHFKEVGFKFSQWIDVGFWQRSP